MEDTKMNGTQVLALSKFNFQREDNQVDQQYY